MRTPCVTRGGADSSDRAGGRTRQHVSWVGRPPVFDYTWAEATGIPEHAATIPLRRNRGSLS